MGYISNEGINMFLTGAGGPAPVKKNMGYINDEGINMFLNGAGASAPVKKLFVIPAMRA